MFLYFIRYFSAMFFVSSINENKTSLGVLKVKLLSTVKDIFISFKYFIKLGSVLCKTFYLKLYNSKTVIYLKNN